MIELLLLGKFAIRVDGRSIALQDRKGLGLLAYLAVEGPASRDKLADLLWSDRGQTDARRNLRQRLYELKGRLPEGALATDGEAVGLHPPFETDLARFRAALAAGDVAAAAALWRGELLEGLELPGAEGFDAWLEAARSALGAAHHDALRRLAEEREAAGDLRGALGAHQRLLAADELQELHQREAIRLHALLGERGAALERYERYRETLERELGDAPLPQTRQLAEHIRRSGEAEPARPEPGGGAMPAMRPPLVGREATLAQLKASPPGLTLVLGEPGVGKSRLAEEFAGTVGSWRGLRGLEGSGGSPLYPVAETLRRALAEDAPGLAALEPTWRAECARLVPEFDPARPTAAAPPSLEGRVRFFEGLARALLAAAGPGGALVLDDLHWLDAATLELAGHLARRAGEAGVRLIATAREAELAQNEAAAPVLADLRRDSLLHSLALAPLEERDVRVLVQALSRRDAPVFSRRLHAATAGNPFFLLETLRDLFGAGELRVEASGDWGTQYDAETAAYAELPIPATVREAVLGRVDRVGAATRRLLEAACLAGTDFEFSLVSTATALSEWEGLEALEGAVRANLLEPEQGGYRFNHDLTRRALEDSLSPERQRLLHRRLALTLEAGNGPSVRIAEHFERGRQPQRAARWRVRAGEDAAKIYAYEQASKHYATALENGLEGEEAFKAHKARANLYYLLGDLNLWKKEAEEMKSLALKLRADRLIIEANLELIQIDSLQNNPYKVVTSMERYYDQLSCDFEYVYRGAIHFSGALIRTGNTEKARDVLIKALQYKGQTKRLYIGRLCLNLAALCINVNDLKEANKYGNAAIKILNSSGTTLDQAQCATMKGHLAESSGNMLSAISCYELAKSLFGLTGIVPAILDVNYRLANLYYLNGAKENFRRIVEESLGIEQINMNDYMKRKFIEIANQGEIYIRT